MNNDLISISEAKKLGATCLARRNENGQLEAIISLDNAPNELNCPEKSRFDFVKCPFCEVIHQGRHNFCSYCGADMRGGAE